MPVKVEQINEYLFSDTVQSQKNKKWQWKQKVAKLLPVTAVPSQIERFISNMNKVWKYIFLLQCSL